MNLEKLLKSVPVTRRRTPACFCVFWLLFFPAIFLWVGIIDGLTVADPELQLDMLIALALAVVAAPLTFLVFWPALKQAKLALKKADYMLTCIEKLGPSQQEAIQAEVQNALSATWRSKTYLTTRFQIEPVFGRYCLYGKVVTRKTFGTNQHVILPYQNIAQVVINNQSGRAKEAVNTAFNTLSVVSGAVSAVTGSGGVFMFFEKRPTIVVVDDAGNTYQIDCANADNFLERLTEQIRASMQV